MNITFISWSIVSLFNLFLDFSCFIYFYYVTIIFAFNGSSCYTVSYYNYKSVWPHYIFIQIGLHILNIHPTLYGILHCIPYRMSLDPTLSNPTSPHWFMALENTSVRKMSNAYFIVLTITTQGMWALRNIPHLQLLVWPMFENNFVCWYWSKRGATICRLAVRFSDLTLSCNTSDAHLARKSLSILIFVWLSWG